MFEIKDLLSNIKNKLFLEEVRIDLIKEIIFDETGIELKKEAIKLNNGDLNIKASPVLKTQILLKKEKILNSLKERLGGRSPSNII